MLILGTQIGTILAPMIAMGLFTEKDDFLKIWARETFNVESPP